MNAETLQHTQWTTLADIETSGKISCMDGRHQHCIVGAPGGNIGELILVLSSLERLTNSKLSRQQLESLLANYSSHFDRFYMHTDQHAVAALLQYLEKHEILSNWAEQFQGDTQTFFTQLQRLDSERAKFILPLLSRPEFIGCGHLRLLVQKPKDYQIRKNLVLGTIESFFRLMWLGNKRMQTEMLEGDHAEQQVLVIDAENELTESSTVPYACKDLQQQFVSHSAARRFFHRRDASFIINYCKHLNMNTPDLDALVADIELLSTIQMQNTLQHLAKDLPIIHIVVPGNKDQS